MAATNADASQDPADDPRFQKVDGWYFDFLRRELELKAQGESALYLRHYLKLRPGPAAAEPARAGASGPAAGSPGSPSGGAAPKEKPAVLHLRAEHRVTEYSVRINARSGETVSWYIDCLAADGDTSGPEDELLQVATSAGQPPDGAKRASAGYEVMSGRSFYRVRWTHEHSGLPVEGDFIEVMVNGKHRRAFSVTRMWRKPDLSGKEEER